MDEPCSALDPISTRHRGPDARAQARLHDRDRHPQHAAGRPRLRPRPDRAPGAAAVRGRRPGRRAGRTVLAVTATGREAEDLVAELGTCSTRPRRSPTSRAGRRCRTSGSARAATPSAAGSPCCAGSPPRAPTPRRPAQVVVAPVRSGPLQPQVKGLGDLEPVELRPGDEADLDDVVAPARDAAYTRVDLVEKRGEFAVRGGIVDVFPPTEEHPLRVEFWGDDVEEIRSFAVADQRTLEKVERLWAPPCRELLLTDEVRARAELGESTRSCSSSPTSSPRASPSRAWSRWPRCSSTRWSCWSTCCPPTPTCWCSTPSGSAPGRTTWSRPARSSSGELGGAAAGGGQAPIDLGAASYRDLADVREHARSAAKAVVDLSPFALDEDLDRTDGEPDVDVRGGRAAADAYRGDIERRSPTSRAGSPRAGGRRRPPRATARRSAVEVLGEHDVAARLVDGSTPTPEPARRARHLRRLDHGFVDDGLKLAVLTGDDLSGQDRGRADQALRAPAGHQGPRLRPGHPVAARARGRLPVQSRRPTS
jgi:transcription-repair coupling factor (superfamily II helicase)